MLLSKVRLTKRPTDKCTYHHREALVLLAMAQTSAEEGTVRLTHVEATEKCCEEGWCTDKEAPDKCSMGRLGRQGDAQTSACGEG